MGVRTTFCDALHQAGRLKESQIAFSEAEEMQKKRQPEFPLLYTLQGFRYCDLLLSQGNYGEVERRASQTLEWAKGQPTVSLLSFALDNLSLGRAKTYLMLRQAQHDAPPSPKGKGEPALTYLNRAVDGLRQAGRQDDLPHGLLARAEYYRVTGDLDKAQKDLDEAFTIASRGGMGLHLADCHLEYARLYMSLRGAQATKQPHGNEGVASGSALATTTIKPANI